MKSRVFRWILCITLIWLPLCPVAVLASNMDMGGGKEQKMEAPSQMSMCCLTVTHDTVVAETKDVDIHIGDIVCIGNSKIAANKSMVCSDQYPAENFQQHNITFEQRSSSRRE